MQELPYSPPLNNTRLGKSVFRRPDSPIWSQKSAFIGDCGIVDRNDAIELLLEGAQNDGCAGYMLCPPNVKEARVYV